MEVRYSMDRVKPLLVHAVPHVVTATRVKRKLDTDTEPELGQPEPEKSLPPAVPLCHACTIEYERLDVNLVRKPLPTSALDYYCFSCKIRYRLFEQPSHLDLFEPLTLDSVHKEKGVAENRELWRHDPDREHPMFPLPTTLRVEWL